MVTVVKLDYIRASLLRCTQVIAQNKDLLASQESLQNDALTTDEPMPWSAQDIILLEDKTEQAPH